MNLSLSPTYGMSGHTEYVLQNLACDVGPKFFKSFQFVQYVFSMSHQQQRSETNVLAKIINNGSKTAVLKSRSRDDTQEDVNFDMRMSVFLVLFNFNKILIYKYSSMKKKKTFYEFLFCT